MSDAVGPVRRRLAAIFCADVAGYSRLMNADEIGTLRLLTAHREIMDRLIPQHGGRIANTAGDSILAEFPSAVAALQCALDIQERVAAVNDEAPESRRVAFRIGLHVGEAMVRNGDLFGDDVNVAARMESLAEPGAVCLSAGAHEHIHRVLPLTYADLGPQAVKNFDAPIRAYLVRPERAANRAIPPVHRSHDFYLARRYHSALFGPLKEVLAPEGLETTDPPILSSLNDAPAIDLNRLAERLGMAAEVVRLALARLVRHGLVEQATTQNSAAPTFRLTPTGFDRHVHVQDAISTIRDRVMAPLSEGERHALQALLARVIKADEVTASRPTSDGCAGDIGA